MVTGKNQGRRSARNQLGFSVLRYLVPLTFMVIGATVGALIWHFFDADVIGWVSGLATSLCLLCLTAVWSIRDKASMLTDSDSLNSVQLKSRAQSEDRVVQYATYLSAAVVACALAASLPTVAKQLTGVMWQWMVIAGGMAVGFAIFSYFISSGWERTLRQIRNADSAQFLEATERLAVMERITRNTADAPIVPSWASNPESRQTLQPSKQAA